MVSMQPKLIGLFYGDGLKSNLLSRDSAIRTAIAAKFRDGDITGGLIAGLSDITDVSQIKIAQQGAPITINHPTDFTGLGRVFGWFAGICIFGVFILLFVKFYQEKERRRAAQRNAQTARAKCTSVINGFAQPLALCAARINKSDVSENRKNQLLSELTDLQASFDRTSQEFDALNRSHNNPDVSNLSVEEYRDMEQQYNHVAEIFKTLTIGIDDIQRTLNQPEEVFKPEEIVRPQTPSRVSEDNLRHQNDSNVQSTRNPERDYQATESPRPQQSAPATVTNNTTIVHEDNSPDLLTTMLVLNALEDDHERSDYPHHHHNDDDDQDNRHSKEPILSTVPTNGTGLESSWETSSTGSGNEEALGTSSNGTGGETSWEETPIEEDEETKTVSWETPKPESEPDFGRVQDDPEPESTKPSDCDCDCDCKPSDCRASDCDCSSDCNCDCSSGSDD